MINKMKMLKNSLLGLGVLAFLKGLFAPDAAIGMSMDSADYPAAHPKAPESTVKEEVSATKGKEEIKELEEKKDETRAPSSEEDSLKPNYSWKYGPKY